MSVKFVDLRDLLRGAPIDRDAIKGLAKHYGLTATNSGSFSVVLYGEPDAIDAFLLPYRDAELYIPGNDDDDCI